MEFKVGDKIILISNKYTHTPIGSVGQLVYPLGPTVHWVLFSGLPPSSDAGVTQASYPLRFIINDVVISEGLTELERLYYGIDE